MNDAASSVMDALPAPAAEAIQAAASAIQPGAERLWAYVNSNPKAGTAAAGLAVGLPLVTYWRARLSGYSGQLQPNKALDLLNKSNTLLVDIRYSLHQGFTHPCGFRLAACLNALNVFVSSPKCSAGQRSDRPSDRIAKCRSLAEVLSCGERRAKSANAIACL